MGWTASIGSELSCVRLVTAPATPADAAAACSEMPSGHLVTILRDDGLVEVVLSLTEGMNVWVGASHNVSESNRTLGWSWVDGSPGADQLLNCGKTHCGAWAVGQPRRVLAQDVKRVRYLRSWGVLCMYVSVSVCMHEGVHVPVNVCVCV